MAVTGKIENDSARGRSIALVCGDTSEETVIKEISAMPGVSHLKGSEALILETRRRLLCNSRMGERYRAIARQFASEYASLKYSFKHRKKPLFGGRI